MKVEEIQNLFLRLAVVDVDMSIGRIAVFMDVASVPETTPSEIANRLNLTLATTSRHLAYWSNRDRHRKDGKGFVEYFEDLMDRRLRLVRLTPQGRIFLKSLTL